MAYVCTKHEAGSCLLDVRMYNDPSVLGFTPESNFLHNETAVEGAQCAHADRKRHSRNVRNEIITKCVVREALVWARARRVMLDLMLGPILGLYHGSRKGSCKGSGKGSLV